MDGRFKDWGSYGGVGGFLFSRAYRLSVIDWRLGYPLSIVLYLIKVVDQFLVSCLLMFGE